MAVVSEAPTESEQGLQPARCSTKSRGECIIQSTPSTIVSILMRNRIQTFMDLALALRSDLRRSTSISICVHLSYSCTTFSGSASLLRSLTFWTWTERLLFRAWKSILARNAGSSVLAATLAGWLVMFAALQTIFVDSCLHGRLSNVRITSRKGSGQAIAAEMPHT